MKGRLIKRRAQSWLEPVRLAVSKRFAAHELAQIERIVNKNRERFLEAWHGYHGG